jgi:hypothetical protein
VAEDVISFGGSLHSRGVLSSLGEVGGSGGLVGVEGQIGLQARALRGDARWENGEVR